MSSIFIFPNGDGGLPAEISMLRRLVDVDSPDWFPRIWPSSGNDNVAHWVEPGQGLSYCGMASVWDLCQDQDETVRKCSRCVEMLNTRERLDVEVR